MGDSAKVSSYDGLVLHLVKVIVVADPAVVSVDMPITVASSLTTPAYAGASAASAGASQQSPRHASRWGQESKGVGSLNRDIVSGSSGFVEQSVRSCKIKSVSVVRADGATDFGLAIFQKSGRSVLTDLKAFAVSGSADRADVVTNPPLDYADESTTVKGDDGVLYCQLNGGTLGVNCPSGTYHISLEVEPT